MLQSTEQSDRGKGRKRLPQIIVNKKFRRNN